jgi:5-methyltetrahydrofolate--homocysteine methyltransferase
MVHIAKEMERAGLSIPLLIGGATTSKVHTAVKIEQHYTKGQTVHVLDASRSVTVVESLLGYKKEGFVQDLKVEYARLREHHEKHRGAKQLLTLLEAQENKLKLNFGENTIYSPNFLGVKSLNNIDLREISAFIDWTPFFQTWELHGRFPAILKDEVVGKEATKLFEDAQHMLEQIIREKWLEARAVFGLFPANSVGDDIEIYEDLNRETILTIQRTLRQQTKKTAGQPNIALADYIAPRDLGINDYIGGFVVTTGIGIDEHIERFEKNHDDYSSIMLKALADRLAEALAEYLHAEVRSKYWGYGANEVLSNEDVIAEKYRGIRPAPGYPACPDHQEKIGLFSLLNATDITGVSLTESLAMMPASSVSGWYFGHPDARYFGLGKITMEQVEDVAKRKDVSVTEIERWYSSILN